VAHAGTLHGKLFAAIKTQMKLLIARGIGTVLPPHVIEALTVLQGGAVQWDEAAVQLEQLRSQVDKAYGEVYADDTVVIVPCRYQAVYTTVSGRLATNGACGRGAWQRRRPWAFLLPLWRGRAAASHAAHRPKERAGDHAC
jgi:hypothetical protein